jgi:hypothetical protein
MQVELSRLADDDPVLEEADTAVGAGDACADLADDAARVASLLDLVDHMKCADDSKAAQLLALVWVDAAELKAKATSAALTVTKATTSSLAITAACERAMALTATLAETLTAVHQALR